MFKLIMKAIKNIKKLKNEQINVNVEVFFLFIGKFLNNLISFERILIENVTRRI